MDTALFCGLLVHLADALALDYAYIEEHTTGFAEALARAREISADVAATARAAASTADVARFFELFCKTERVVTCFSQGVNQSAQGTDKVNAIINVHLATGRIGRPGMGPFSLTGQPNAMGGREVGGLANQLAAHMGFSPAERDRVAAFGRRRAWRPRKGSRRSICSRPSNAERSRRFGLWRPIRLSLCRAPTRCAMRSGNSNCSSFPRTFSATDTIEAGKHPPPPAAAWARKRRNRHQFGSGASRGSVRSSPLPGEARPDSWIVDARWRGAWVLTTNSTTKSPADIFREHAALSAFENDGRRGFDIGALAGLSDASYDGLDPVMWPARAGEAAERAAIF